MKEEIEYLKSEMQNIDYAKSFLLSSFNHKISMLEQLQNDVEINRMEKKIKLINNIIEFIENNYHDANPKYKQGQLVYISSFKSNGRVLSVKIEKGKILYVVKEKYATWVNIPEEEIEEYKE